MAVATITSITPSSRPVKILFEAGSYEIQMTSFGNPFDHFLMNFEDPYSVCQASILPTSMNLPPSFYQGSFVLVTLALSLETGLISAVATKKSCYY